MAAKRVFTDENRTEEISDRNFDHYAGDRVHPRLAAKKTFFDLHRHRRLNGAEASESETNFHPRIQWSAGTTTIGSGYRIETHDDSVTRDIMKPVLRRESSRPDEASIFAVSRRNLPPLPDAWGSMDAQPTQPEEIQHLLILSPVIRRTNISEKTIKPKRKFIKNILKCTNAALSNTSLESTRALEDEVQTVKPEEEFKLLNERYVREGIIPVESLTKKSIHILGSTSRGMSSDTQKGKRPSVKGSVHVRASDERKTTPQHFFDHERGIGSQSTVEKDRKSSILTSMNEKHVTIHTEEVQYRSPDHSSTSPLPARRSCEPLDVKSLRKLRESEPEPGTSGVGRRDLEYSQESIVENFDTVFLTKTPKMSTDDDRGEDDSEDSAEEAIKSDVCNIDTFKIDKPFSDFSLKKIINGEKGLLRQYSAETIVETPTGNPDLAQPSTSNGAHAIEICRQKVSRTESVEQPEKNTREQSFFQSAVSRLRKASLSDNTAASSQSSLDVIEENLIPRNSAKVHHEQSEIRRLGWSLLYAFIRNLVGAITGQDD